MLSISMQFYQIIICVISFVLSFSSLNFRGIVCVHYFKIECLPCLELDSLIHAHLTVIFVVSKIMKRIASVNQVAILENIRYFLQASIN